MQQPTSSEEQNGCYISTTTANKIKRLCKPWRILNELLLCVLIIGVWSLLSLPVIFYQFKESETTSSTGANKSVVSGDYLCSGPLKYATSNGVCLTELTNILISSNCSLGPWGNVLVVKNDEAMAIRLVNGLSSLGASTECKRKAIPFLCQYLFGLCGGSGVSIQPTSSQCEEVRDNLCQQEWMFIEQLGVELPNCVKFPTGTSSCPALNGNRSTNGTVLEKEKNPQLPNGTTVAMLECSEGFYQDNNSSICIPSCYTWSQHNKGLSTFVDVVTLTCTVIGFIGAAVVIIISCLARKRMLTFPSIFIVYMMMDALIYAFVVAVGFMDRNSLFCSSRSLFESVMKVTPFCIISGIVFIYTTNQYILWWLFHIAILFWRIVFPFHAQSHQNLKYIHIMCVILGILLPLIPNITSMADFAMDLQNQIENSTTEDRTTLFLSGGLGFGPARVPAFTCTIVDRDANFYSYIIIVDIIMACGCTMILIIVCSLHRLYKEKKKKKNVKYNFGKAEKKLIIIFCYALVLTIIYLAWATLIIRNASQLVRSFQRVFFCEQGGHNSSNPCSHSEIEDLSYPSLEILSLILQAMFPLVNMIYVVNIQELKEIWRGKCLQTHH